MRLYSISRWSKEDGERLQRDIEAEFEKGNRQVYWDDVPIFIHSDGYELGIMEMDINDVVEIDNIKELISVDRRYGYLEYGGKGCKKAGNVGLIGC